MAISYGAISAVIDNLGVISPTLSVPYPAGVVAGQILTLFVACKSPPATPDAVTGFTLVGTHTAGEGDNTQSDRGQVTVAVFKRVADATETGNVSVSIPDANAVTAQAFMTSHTKSNGSATWETAFTTGSQTAITNAWSVVCAANPGMLAGDVILALFGVNTNAKTDSNAHALAAAGVTEWGTPVKRVHLATDSGRDQAIGLAEFRVVGGTATAAPTFTANMTPGSPGAASPTGPVLLFRLREQGPPDETPPTINGPATVNVAENTTTVATYTADEPVTWSISGGADSALFAISSAGVLSFLSGRNFESPSDVGANNVYDVTIRATDLAPTPHTTDLAVAVTVTNANDSPSFGGPDIAAQTGTVGTVFTPLDITAKFTDQDAGDSATYTATGTWPAGITVTTAGVIQGTPAAAGTFTGLRVRRTDGAGATGDSNAFTFTISSGVAAATTASFLITTDGETPVPNLSSLKFAYFDEATPNLWTAPKLKGTNGTTNASGVMTLNITGVTGLSVGSVGSVVATNSNGTVNQGATLRFTFRCVAVS